MEAACALLYPLPGDCRRIVAKDRFAGVVSLPKANALAPTQVDSRPDFHPLVPRDWISQTSCRPSCFLFYRW